MQSLDLIHLAIHFPTFHLAVVRVENLNYSPGNNLVNMCKCKKLKDLVENFDMLFFMEYSLPKSNGKSLSCSRTRFIAAFLHYRYFIIAPILSFLSFYSLSLYHTVLLSFYDQNNLSYKTRQFSSLHAITVFCNVMFIFQSQRDIF